MCAFQEPENVIFEITSSFYLSLIEKELCASGFDLSCDLLSNPSIGAAMANKYQPLIRKQIAIHSTNLSLPTHSPVTTSTHPVSQPLPFALPVPLRLEN